MAGQQHLRGATGDVVGISGTALTDPAAVLPSHVLGVEQSNSSMVFDNKYFLKLYRKLEDGVNPDVEVTRFLSENTGFAIVPQGGGQFVKILQCRNRGATSDRECEIHGVENGQKSSQIFWWDAKLIGDAEQRAFTEDPSLRKTAPAPRAPAQPAPKPEAAAPGGNGACPRTPYGGPVAGNTSASADLFKRKVADNYTMRTRDPYWYGVTFESFAVGAPIKNTVSNQPGKIALTWMWSGAQARAMLLVSWTIPPLLVA